MKSQGAAIIYVSHRLEEVVALADRCTVLRDGRVAVTSRRGAFAVGDLVQAMTGRVEMNIPAGAGAPGPVVLEDADKRPDAISLRANEVVGLAGLLGSGTGRVLRRLFGLDAGGATTRVGGEVQRPGVRPTPSAPASEWCPVSGGSASSVTCRCARTFCCRASTA